MSDERGRMVSGAGGRRGLSAPPADPHAVALGCYLDRLRVCAERGDSGPDPWADRRVPSFRYPSARK